jgi:hypothetical protein
MSEKAQREITPADLRLLEPDVLGALALVLHGRDGRIEPRPRSAPASWRGRGRHRQPG